MSIIYKLAKTYYHREQKLVNTQTEEAITEWMQSNKSEASMDLKGRIALLIEGLQKPEYTVTVMKQTKVAFRKVTILEEMK